MCFLKIWADPIAERHDQTFSHTVICYFAISQYQALLPGRASNYSLGWRHSPEAWCCLVTSSTEQRTVSRIARSEREAGERAGLMLAPTKHLISLNITHKLNVPQTLISFGSLQISLFSTSVQMIYNENRASFAKLLISWELNVLLLWVWSVHARYKWSRYHRCESVYVQLLFKFSWSRQDGDCVSVAHRRKFATWRRMAQRKPTDSNGTHASLKDVSTASTGWLTRCEDLSRRHSTLLNAKLCRHRQYIQLILA